MGYDGGRVLDLYGSVVHFSGDESHIVPIRNFREVDGVFYTADNVGGLVVILRCDPKII